MILIDLSFLSTDVNKKMIKKKEYDLNHMI